MQLIKIIRTVLIITSLMMIAPNFGPDKVGTVYAAKKKKKKKKRKSKSRRGVTTKRYKIKKGESTRIDLDAVDLTGAAKKPMTDLIGAAKPERGYDFIKLRTQWIIEMKQSASSLEKGVEGGRR